MKPPFARLVLGAAALACGALASHAPLGAQTSNQATAIRDNAAAERLRRNKGLTLQWIDWNRRGHAAVTIRRGVWTLRGAQAEAGGPGRLFLEGRVAEIGRDYFLFDGLVRIADTPDRGRLCEKRDVWRFAITQNRKFWRIRSFEWCDGLTDYIDIYF